MHIIERYYFVDDAGKEHLLKSECTRSIDSLGSTKAFLANAELHQVRDEEILAELRNKNFYRKPWWKFW